ncbi:MAG: D-aminoacyl-tRNA deacylase [Burkholderiales bacterium]|nr:D-aminoacyl-tRNA deacylase [Bacteroidia bacterium]
MLFHLTYIQLLCNCILFEIVEDRKLSRTTFRHISLSQHLIQFAVFASIKKGNRPSFIKSAEPDIAIPHYEYCIQYLSQLIIKPIKTVDFAADIKVSLINDGHVTILMDSKNRE